MDLKPALGASTSFSKTVSESDVYLFAGITGDFAPNHVDEQFMRKTPMGGALPTAPCWWATCRRLQPWSTP
jgi:acyl dehydratase